ncbi:hypothetical protein SCLCIDRAFT_936874 [Scleroderma citrinum Foug A]|uniref:Uncharacterized protein n=1 Tax=Scleroderma citrinum Foug A TaxID=1036808 RepID=A0A0C3DXL5_9AGAM|nr:hypothetical protein SCLCIDRAFT_936874 [Scleroderma citrinum Foug A]
MQNHLAPVRPRSRRSLSHSLESLHSQSKHCDDVPIPPTLVNSPYLSSEKSVFRRKASIRRWPSRSEDEWLGDMVAVNGDNRSEQSDSVPSSCTSAVFHSHVLPPPSPILRPRSSPPDVYMTATHIPLVVHRTRYGQALYH